MPKVKLDKILILMGTGETLFFRDYPGENDERREVRGEHPDIAMKKQKVYFRPGYIDLLERI